jgi:hypothetical protein
VFVHGFVLVGWRSELVVEDEDQQADHGVDPEEDGECDFHGVGELCAERQWQ